MGQKIASLINLDDLGSLGKKVTKDINQ